MKRNIIITTTLIIIVIICLSPINHTVLATTIKAKAVTNLHARETSSGAIQVSWNRVSNRDYYKMKATCDGKPFRKGTYKIKSAAFKFTNIEAGHKYRFTVQTVCGSSKSSQKTVAINVNSPIATTTLQSNSGGRRCSLIWNKIDGVDGYELLEKNYQNGTTKMYTYNNPGQLTAIIVGKGIGEKYGYTVRGYRVYDKTIYGGWSNEVIINTKKTRIGQATSNYDGKAGDSSGKELAPANWSYSTSSTNYRNWTYVFRFKDEMKAEAAASMLEEAMANDNIGYCSTGTRTYGSNAIQKVAKPLNWDLSKVDVKTGCACGDIIMLCIRYSGIDCRYIGDGLGCAKELKKLSNHFTCYTAKKYVASDAFLKRGDILITAHPDGKNNHVCMVL